MDIYEASQLEESAQGKLMELADELESVHWPKSFRGDKIFAASSVLHVIESLPDKERSRVVLAWNSWIAALANLRQAQLEEFLTKPKGLTRNGVVWLIYFVVHFSIPVIGYWLGSWIGLGLGLLLFVMVAESVAAQEREYSRAWDEYCRRKKMSMDRHREVMGWTIHRSANQFLRDLVPWEHSQTSASEQLAAVQD